jgi:hypothetical protein
MKKNIALILVSLHVMITCTNNSFENVGGGGTTDEIGAYDVLMNNIFNFFSDQERIIVFDPDKSKVQITLDAKSLLFPTDPSQTNDNGHNDNDNDLGGHSDHDSNHSNSFSLFNMFSSDENGNGDNQENDKVNQITNQAKDKPLKCRDKSINLRNNSHQQSENSGYTYPFIGQCANPIDKLALNIQTIELINGSGFDDDSDSHNDDNDNENDDSNDDDQSGHHEDDDNENNYSVVATVYNNTQSAPININSDGMMVVETLMNPVTFNGVKITFGDGNGLVYRNGAQRTTKALKIKGLPQPAITDEIELKSAWVTSINLALDNAKMTFGKTEDKNELQGKFRYRKINSYEGAWAYVTSYDNPDGGLEAPRVALPLTVDQTSTELYRQLALMPGRTFISEDTANPKMYHALIYIDNPKHKSILKVMGIMNDFFPLFGNNTWATQPGGIIDTSEHMSGFFVYALISDFQYNLLLAFKLFKAFDVIEQVNYETLAYAGYHMGSPVAEPTELEFAEAEEAFQVAINSGLVTFPTAATAIGTLNVNMRYNFWSSLQNTFSSIGRAIADAVRVVVNAVFQLVTQIARVVGIIFNPSGQVRGQVGFRNDLNEIYSKQGSNYNLPETLITIRQSDFILNGTEVFSSASGDFYSGPLASSVGDKTLKYNIRVVLENPVARVYNANPFWPMVIDLKEETGSGDMIEIKADNKYRSIIPWKSSNLFAFGVLNFAAKRSRALFDFQPDQATVITAGVVNDAMTSVGTKAMAPAGHLSEASYLLALAGAALAPMAAGFIFSGAVLLNYALQLDGDIYYGPAAKYNEATIVHEYGHYIMFNKIDQRFLISPVTGILTNYLQYFKDDNLGKAGVYPNAVRLLEAWAEFFAFNALSTMDGSVFDITSTSARIANSYFTAIDTDIDGLNGLEINYGSPIVPSASDPIRNTVGRDASILQDLYDSNSDLDTASGQTDRMELGKNILKFISDTAPFVCTLNLFAGTTDPCNFNVLSMFNEFVNSTTFAQLAYFLDNGSPDTSLMNLYQMHGFVFSGNTPNGTIINYSPGTGNLELQNYSQSTGIVLRGSSSTRLTWSAGSSGNYFLRISDNCVTGDMSTGANGSGVYTANIQVESTILLSQLQPGPNNVTICLESDGLMEQLSYIVYRDETSPTTSANPPGGSFSGTQNVTLTCTDDTNGSGCDQIYYTKDGSDPLTSSSRIISTNPAYATIRCNETLKFFATDLAGNLSPVYSQTYSNGTACCVNQPNCVNQSVCGTTNQSVENSECWDDFFDAHYCICGSQAIWPWNEKPCYVNVSVPYCTTQQVCTDNWVCNY